MFKFIEKAKENEQEFMGFRTYEPIELGNGVSLKIKANSMSNCTPEDDLPLEEYENIELVINGSELDNIITNLFGKYTEVDGSMVVNHAPIDKVEELYLSLLNTNETVQEVQTVTNMDNSTASSEDVVEKINDIINALNKKFYEREAEVEGMLVGLLSKQHILLIGEPGTGKSLLSMELSKIIDNSSYFQWLMTRYTTPEELFGALSIEELEKGIHKRNVSGKLPEAELVFLDEIFKSNSAILNSLLTLINERLFYNNSQPVESPLISLVGASNEYPEEDEGLEALFDRLLLRYEVEEVKDRSNFVSMLKNENNDIEIPSISLLELEKAQQDVSNVNVSDDIFNTVADIVQELNDEGIRPSARRVKNSVEAIKAKAYIAGRNYVEPTDLAILEHILWNDIYQKEDAVSIVKDYAQDIVQNTIEMVQVESSDLMNIYRQKQNDGTSTYDDITETAQKLKALTDELTKLLNKNPDREDEIKPILNKVAKEQQKVIDEALMPINTN